jgi:hypothetical protein
MRRIRGETMVRKVREPTQYGSDAMVAASLFARIRDPAVKRAVLEMLQVLAGPPVRDRAVGPAVIELAPRLTARDD